MRKTILPILLISFFLYFSLWPTMYEWNNRGRIKPERHFELVHNFPTDYNLYLSKIRQGKESAWLAKEKYTSESHNGSLIQVLYVFIGRTWDGVGGQTQNIWLAYHLMRVFFGALLLLITWKVVVWIFKERYIQIFAFLLVVTASTWPKLEIVNGLARFGGYMPWWSVIDSLQRITFIPHILLGQVLVLFILWSIGKGSTSVFLGIVGLLLGIVFPPGLLFVYGVLALMTLWEKKHIFERLLFGIISVPSLIYFSLLFSHYPWKRLVEFDVLHPVTFSFVEYFLAVGPVLPLGLFGAFIGFRERKLRIFIAWIVTWLLFLIIFSKIPQQSPTRFTEMIPHVPLGILVAYLLHRFSRSFIPVFVVTVVVALGLGSMYSSMLWQRDFIDHKLRADYPLVPKGAEVMYPLKDLIDAIDWLQTNTPRDAIVLSGQSTGNLIPVYSGNTVYVGHANTVDLEKKLITVEQFYKGTDMSGLGKERIDYILFGPEEMEWTAYAVKDLRVWYPSLIPVYQNNRVVVYTFPSAFSN